jgi:hypothetical protein
MTPNVSAAEISAVRYTIENPNCMNRFVQWFRDDEVSTILKVSVLVLAVFALVGAGLLIADPIVAILVTVLPTALFGFWALREHYVLNRSEVQPAPQSVGAQPATTQTTQLAALPNGSAPSATNNRSGGVQPAMVNTTQLPVLPNYPAPGEDAPLAEQIAWAFGGEEHLSQLPILAVPSEAQGDEEYPDFFKASHLSVPIMKGKMNDDRPFIVIRVKDNQTAEGDPKHIGVVTFFQRATDNTEQWHGAGHTSKCIALFYTALGLRHWKIVHQIVVERNHPRYTLV